jgi:hypothetical protein
MTQQNQSEPFHKLAAVFPSCGESLKLTYKKRMNKKEVKQDPEP